jgi:hypothetical protein
MQQLNPKLQTCHLTRLPANSGMYTVTLHKIGPSLRLPMALALVRRVLRPVDLHWSVVSFALTLATRPLNQYWTDCDLNDDTNTANGQPSRTNTARYLSSCRSNTVRRRVIPTLLTNERNPFVVSKTLRRVENTSDH